MIQTSIQDWLKGFIAAQDAVAGTVHWYIQTQERTGLELIAAINIPPKVQEIVEWVPPGKGMAGQALVQGAPVQTCNLKDDSSGAVRPGAKAVDAVAAVALPVKSVSGEISAIVGIAYSDQRQFSDADLTRLEQAAGAVLLAHARES
jgi:L-methionine (R)-S-oxide reductase